MPDAHEFGEASTEAFQDLTLSDLRSPIEEHHIDFILEEEFICNPEFLTFFLRAAQMQMDQTLDHQECLKPYPDWHCHAVRSATTLLGETDVLVIYRSASKVYPRIAILIEDKIRATFQDRQADRYKERGKAGLGADRQWDFYWTCLIAPEKYSDSNSGFDTRVSLEKLIEFFSGQDKRSQFKARTIGNALIKFSERGLQKKDENMTLFRKFYADEAAKFFRETEVVWEQPRDAWLGDTWFIFRQNTEARRLNVTYKSQSGSVDLTFSNINVQKLESVFHRFAGKSRATAKQIGKSSAALTIQVARIEHGGFTDCPSTRAIVMQSLEGVRELIDLYDTIGDSLELALRSSDEQSTDEFSSLALQPETSVEIGGVISDLSEHLPMLMNEEANSYSDRLNVEQAVSSEMFSRGEAEKMFLGAFNPAGLSNARDSEE